MNDALRLFLNRYVLVQFREQQWLVPSNVGGKPQPTAIDDPASGQKVPLAVPFVVAKLVEKEGQLLFQFMDFRLPEDRPSKFEMVVNPDVIFTVSAISEDRIIAAP